MGMNVYRVSLKMTPDKIAARDEKLKAAAESKNSPVCIGVEPEYPGRDTKQIIIVASTVAMAVSKAQDDGRVVTTVDTVFEDVINYY